LVGLFNKKKEKMSWQIPTQVEQDIIAGKATYRTFQTGNGGQSILPVPANSYAVIFGYDFSPAGGGLKRSTIIGSPATYGLQINLTDTIIRWFETQQISFYTGTDFYPFIHHVDVKTNAVLGSWNAVDINNVVAINNVAIEEIDNTPISRQVYITSPRDVTITHGLILTTDRRAAEAIPVTSRTPGGLTYGGSGQIMNIATDYSGGATAQNFTQPAIKGYDEFAFATPLQANPTPQAYAIPDVTDGLRDATQYLNTLGADFLNAAACQYYLCLHYALYNTQIPNNQG
tara:strand:+ start:4299 stop:5159 length:861 start_codon:yes stop_codon:yes gene_type:complete